MPEIGIRELKVKLSETIRQVKENGIHYIVTRHGKPIAILSAVEKGEREQEPIDKDQGWVELEQIGEQIAQLPRSEKSVTIALTESRR